MVVSWVTNGVRIGRPRGVWSVPGRERGGVPGRMASASTAACQADLDRGGQRGCPWNVGSVHGHRGLGRPRGAVLQPTSRIPPHGCAVRTSDGRQGFAAAARPVRTGEVFSLDLPLDGAPLAAAPHGRPPLRHRARMHNEVRPRPGHDHVVVNDDIVELAMRDRRTGMHSPIGRNRTRRRCRVLRWRPARQTFPGFGARTLGIGLLGGAVVTRGVLLDLVQHKHGRGAAFLDHEVVVDRGLIESCVEEHRLRLEPGDE